MRALLDDQELDSRTSTGAIYWEGLSLLVDASGAPVGRGYLEIDVRLVPQEEEGLSTVHVEAEVASTPAPT